MYNIHCPLYTGCTKSRKLTANFEKTVVTFFSADIFNLKKKYNIKQTN